MRQETYWRKIEDLNHRYIDGRNLMLTVGRPFVILNSGRLSNYQDISVVIHKPKKFSFEGIVLEIDAGLSIGEFETERITVIGCVFNKSFFVCGKDYRRDKDISLEEARILIPDFLSISRQEFSKLFQLSGMNERCLNGIREILE